METTVRNHRILSFGEGEIALYFIGMEEEALALKEKLAGKGITLRALLIDDWNNELSPYPRELEIFHQHIQARGEADKTIEILQDVMKLSEKKKPTLRLLMGYSMGGLFTLYCLTRSLPFSGYLSISGSLWYPDFVSYFSKQDFTLPQAVYLSLGEKETKSRNPLFAQGLSAHEAILLNLKQRHIPSVFALNPGNHFQDPVGRELKGLSWILKTLKAQ